MDRKTCKELIFFPRCYYICFQFIQLPDIELIHQRLTDAKAYFGVSGANSCAKAYFGVLGANSDTARLTRFTCIRSAQSARIVYTVLTSSLRVLNRLL